MQEEIEQKSVTLAISTTKLTGRVLRTAISKFLAHRKEVRMEKARDSPDSVTPKGRQTVKELVGQNQGVSSIEVSDRNIRDFDRVARKYGVDYAVKKDKTNSRYLVFFKARDADALTAAFEEYTAKAVNKGKQSVRTKVQEKDFKGKDVDKTLEKVKEKAREQER